MPFGLKTQVGPRNHVLDAGSDPPWEGEIYRRRATHCKVWPHSAVSCAKTAGPIEMPFGICTSVRSKKHLLGVGACWCHLANTIEPSMCSGNAACSVGLL